MYNNPQNGQASAVTDAPTPQPAADQVNGLRNLILDLLFGSPVITAKEWATAVERTSNTLSLETLAKWYGNAVAEISRREAAAAPVTYATGEQKQQIIRLCNHPAVSRPRKTKVLLNLNRLTEAEADAVIANLAALTNPTPTRPAGAGLVVNRRGQLAVAALTGYARKAVTLGGVSVSYVEAA